jgi:hypothetical protein
VLGDGSRQDHPSFRRSSRFESAVSNIDKQSQGGGIVAVVMVIALALALVWRGR